ncbi:MAG: DUF1957 domain-containing protein [Candidatus Omnitrophica bacterium]|nr:DUF1957 domain-containing protein [Candidatus Omnitrophota bacterium]
MSKGYLSLVLHAHLPFVRHPEEEYFLEENWLFEAITETYIPLINVYDGLVRDGINFRITMSMTPPLVAMLKDPLLQQRYIRHLDKLIELSEKEIERTGFEPHYHGLALMYNERFRQSKEVFVNKYNCDLVSAFKKFQDMGYLEIITCCATHGFLPILGVNPAAAKAQVQVGVESYTKAFGRPPRGIWLPECGYAPGVDKFLRDAGIRFFFVDSHGLVHADPVPKYSVYAPIYCPTGVAAFARDWESSKQVWSAKEGYPGDVDYREYYRDIGHQLDFDYIKPYIHPDGIRVNTGIKYWRITGDTEYKEAYRPDWAREKAASHAGNFMFNREKQVKHLAAHMDRKPIIVAPYDAELFGHWWFEGPMWIDFLMRKIVCDQDTVELITPSEYLEENPKNQMAVPSASSWGYKGYNEFWLEGDNDWVYRHLHMAAKRMVELADKFALQLKNNSRNTLARRALNQAARELLLAESSDWPFIMKTGTMVPYANKRVKQHVNRFTRLYNDLLNGTIDKAWLAEVESRDNIFQNIDCATHYVTQGKNFFRKSVKVQEELLNVCNR